MKTLAATLLFSMACPGLAYACSGTGLVSAPATRTSEAVERGQHYDDLDHLLRNKANGEVLVCAEDRCYPAIVVADEHPIELMRLQGCRIADAATTEGGMERHEMDTPGFDRPPE